MDGALSKIAMRPLLSYGQLRSRTYRKYLMGAVAPGSDPGDFTHRSLAETAQPFQPTNAVGVLSGVHGG